MGAAPPPEGGIWDFIATSLHHTIAFSAGFMIGGLSGYFGNWLWHRFGPHRGKPHLDLSSDPASGSITISGRIDNSNRGQAIKLIQASAQPRTRSTQVTIPSPVREDSDSTA